MPPGPTSDGPRLCLRGYFCPPGSHSATAHPCPRGTFGPRRGATAELYCELCPAGSWLLDVGPAEGLGWEAGECVRGSRRAAEVPEGERLGPGPLLTRHRLPSPVAASRKARSGPHVGQAPPTPRGHGPHRPCIPRASSCPVLQPTCTSSAQDRTHPEFSSEAWGCWRERTASPSPGACGSESLLEGVCRRGIAQEGWGWCWSMREVREGPLSPALGSASSRDVLLLRRTVSAVGALPPLPLLLRGSGVSHPHPTQGT